MVNIATLFTEEIEKNFRGHVPPECVRILIVMADQMLQMEAAINSQQKIIQKLMHFSALSQTHHKQIMEELKKHDKRFDNSPITEAVEDPDGGIH